MPIVKDRDKNGEIAKSVYAWRENARIKGNADKIGHELDDLAASLGRTGFGDLTNREIVDWVIDNPDSETAKNFRFDEEGRRKAADSWYLHTAGRIQRSLECTIIFSGGHTKTVIGRVAMLTRNPDGSIRHSMGRTELLATDEEKYMQMVEGYMVQFHGWGKRMAFLENYREEIEPMMKSLSDAVRRGLKERQERFRHEQEQAERRRRRGQDRDKRDDNGDRPNPKHP